MTDAAGDTREKYPPQNQERQPDVEAEMSPRPDYAPRLPGAGRLAGKTSFITGGDSGIRRADAVHLAREGANVVIYYKDAHQDSEATPGMICAEWAEALALSGDIGIKAAAKRAIS